MDRRVFVASVAAWPFYAGAAPGSVAVLGEVAELLGVAGEALSKIAKGFRDMIGGGVDTYDYVKAAREKSRLVDISSRLTQVVTTKQRVVVQTLSEYIELAERRIRSGTISREEMSYEWEPFVAAIIDVLPELELLLRDVRVERGDFVLEAGYAELITSLNSRASLLQRLQSMDAPTSKDEIAALRSVNEKYKILLKNAMAAIQELNTYIKSKKKS